MHVALERTRKSDLLPTFEVNTERLNCTVRWWSTYPARVESGEGRRHPTVHLRRSWAAPWAGSGAGHCWTEQGSGTGWGKERRWSAGWRQEPAKTQHDEMLYAISLMQYIMGIESGKWKSSERCTGCLLSTSEMRQFMLRLPKLLW